MSNLYHALEVYLRLRRSLGFKLHDAGLQLPHFIDFLVEREVDHVTIPLALAWAQLPASAQPSEWARRLGYVRVFARYMAATDPRTEIPPSSLLPHRSTRARPYLYTDAQIQELLEAALTMPVSRRTSQLRPWMYHCLLGLLSITGLRISEALNLKLDDVDLEQGLLTIRSAKLGRVRLIPIHRSTCAVLANYLKQRTDFLVRPISDYVFVSNRGTRIDKSVVYRTFYALSCRIGLRAYGVSHGPRLHDFRHRFATGILTRWYGEGHDAIRNMPVLSTWLGHVRIEDTYWYLSLSPELMAHAMARLEQRWGDAS